MAEQTGLSVRYTAASDAERLPALRLTLEPEYIDRRAGLADLADIDAMLQLALAGSSAVNRQLDRCPWASWQEDGSLVVRLALYVWPSDIDLPYTLSVPPGVTSSAPELVRESRGGKYWIAGSQGLELPWLLESAQLHWHSGIGCLDAWSRSIPPPGISQSRARIELDADAYGVLVVNGLAVGWRHTISITYNKVAFGSDEQSADQPQISRIEADDIPVQAGWIDEHGEPQTTDARLSIPACAKALLESCSDGRSRTFGSVLAPDHDAPWIIYYSTCDGHMLARRRARGGGDG